MSSINNTSNATKTAMYGKSPYALPNNPVDNGYTTKQIVEKMCAFVLDSSNSVMSELSRIISEANTIFQTDENTLTTHANAIQNNANDIINLSNSLLANPVNGGTTIYNAPKDAYSTLAVLQAAKPLGDTGIYVVASDCKWYYWNTTNNSWTPGGVYQAMSVPIVNTITESTDGNMITIENNNVYNVSGKTAIELSLPETMSTQFYAEVNLVTGASFGISYSTALIVWKGEDLDNDNEFVPSVNTTYLLQIKCNGSKYLINALEM